ncbi:MAG: hypothetical protein KJO69_08765 [Gammaproteobacteria bacterium]|nr:hypothetical protein [Gammaproteobacteria bacterium]
MGVLNKGTTFLSGDQVTAEKLNNLVDSSTFDATAVDSSTTALSGGAIIVKDAGITTAKLADANVTTAKLADANVTTAKIADANVTTAKLADANVTKAKIENVADMKVLGNTSGSAAAPSEVAILDEDDLVSDSATSLATQQSIKAYADGTSSFSTTNGQSEGYQILPSGLKMAWGQSSETSNGITTFPAGVGFTVPPTVQISYNDSGSPGSYLGVQLGSVTTTQFTYKGSDFNNYGPRYFAIGH